MVLSLPKGDKRKIKKRLYDDLELGVLNSENCTSVLFDFLDKYLMEDQLMNSWTLFEEFVKFEWKHL